MAHQQELRSISLIELEAVLNYLTASGQLDGLLYEEILDLLKTKGFEVSYEDVYLLYEPEINMCKKEKEEEEKASKKQQSSYFFDPETGEYFEKQFREGLDFLGLDIEEEDFDY